MDIQQKLKKQYDHVLVGFNLTSLSFAAKLAEQGLNFCLVDSKHFGSSPFKNVSSLGAEIYPRVPFTPAPTEPLDSTGESVATNLEVTDKAPMTFDKGDFKSFLGFGDSSIVAVDAVMPFCQPQNVVSTDTPEEFWSQNKEILSPHIYLDQKLTDIVTDGDSVAHLVLNANFELRGENFYFFDQFPFLFEKVGSHVKKLASQFAKATWYSSVNLVIHHKEEPELLELDQIYILKGSKEQPCIGQFSRIDGQLFSRWESFFPAELTPDSETTGSYLKEIKKQLKRAFSIPDMHVNPEHILVQNQVFADLSRANLTSGKLGNFSNLGVYSPLFSQTSGWIHELSCGSQITPSLQGDEKSGSLDRIEVAAPQPPC